MADIRKFDPAPVTQPMIGKDGKVDPQWQRYFQTKDRIDQQLLSASTNAGDYVIYDGGAPDTEYLNSHVIIDLGGPDG